MQLTKCEGCGFITSDGYAKRCTDGWGRWIRHLVEHDYCPPCADEQEPREGEKS